MGNKILYCSERPEAERRGYDEYTQSVFQSVKECTILLGPSGSVVNSYTGSDWCAMISTIVPVD